MDLKKKKFLMMMLCSKHRKIEDSGYEDNVIMTKDSNPQVLAICYANGLCQSPDIMYKEEAEAVTTINTVFKLTDIVNFEEFKYFINVTTIVDNAFDNCVKLKTISIPNSITSIGTLAFNNCKELSNIDLGNHVLTIGSNCFRLCSNLIYLNVPDSVVTINNTFISASGVQKLIIGTNIQRIYGRFFASGGSLFTTLIIKAIDPPNIQSDLLPVLFSGNIYVPDISVDDYKTNSNWSTWINNIHPISEYTNDV